MSDASERAERRAERFVALSALLTGCEPVTLLGTGMVESYLQALDAGLPTGVHDALLDAHDALPASERERAAQRILDDPKLGPVARNLILLWYSGAWPPLPAAWHAAFGPCALDDRPLFSGAAYQAGLQWVVAGAHPAGAAQQGFGAWALGPAGAA